MLDIRIFLLTIFGLLIAIDVHECAHAWAADRLGDPTARYMGRITLNPVKHLDPLGSIMILISSFTGFGIGWGKPAPVNPHRLRYGSRTGMALVAAAGPVTNLITATLLALPRHLGLSLPYPLGMILSTIAFLNVIIAVFNLIPIPPLDGFSVLMGILSSIRSPTMSKATFYLSRLEAQGPMVLLGILMLDWVLPFSLLGAVMGQPIDFLWKLIGG